MIRYRYNMSTDPEPRDVTRVRTKHEGYTYEGVDGDIHTVNPYLGDVWMKRSCRTRTGNAVYVNWPRRDHGRAHRSVSKKVWRWERKMIRSQICDNVTDGHYHWYNGDRWRAWGSFRGHTGEVIDLDAFKRLRSMYRRRHR